MILLIIPLALALLFLFAFYVAHIVMTKTESDQWGWGSFSQFLREYKKREWERDIMYRRSHFGVKFWNDQVHAGIIMFDNNGMVLRPFSYLIFVVWLEINKYRAKGGKVKW